MNHRQLNDERELYRDRIHGLLVGLQLCIYFNNDEIHVFAYGSAHKLPLDDLAYFPECKPVALLKWMTWNSTRTQVNYSNDLFSVYWASWCMKWILIGLSEIKELPLLLWWRITWRSIHHKQIFLGRQRVSHKIQFNILNKISYFKKNSFQVNGKLIINHILGLHASV